jgi:hypothetical protein
MENNARLKALQKFLKAYRITRRIPSQPLSKFIKTNTLAEEKEVKSLLNNYARGLTPTQIRARYNPKLFSPNILTLKKAFGYTLNKPKYNANRAILKRNSNANQYIQRAWKNGTLTNIMSRLNIPENNVVPPVMIKNAIQFANKKWILVNKNTGNLYAFALARKEPGSEVYIDLFGAYPTWGSKLMNEIKKNVNTIILNSVASAEGFYRKQGFTGVGGKMTLKRKRNNNSS